MTKEDDTDAIPEAVLYDQDESTAALIVNALDTILVDPSCYEEPHEPHTVRIPAEQLRNLRELCARIKPTG